MNAVQAALNGAIASGDYAKVLNRWGEGVESIPQSEINPARTGRLTGGAMSEAFRDISPEAPELQPIISGLFAEYAARYGDYFSCDAEVELSEWYVPPQGLFIVLEREGEIIATGAYKPKDRHTAEIKRIWTHRRLRQQGLAAKVVQELERRAVLAGYSHIYPTTGFRSAGGGKALSQPGYEAQFDLTRDPEEYSQPPYDGRLRFTKALAVSAYSHSA